MKKVLYPGSFDPITKGHMNIINQASDLFDEVVIAVMQNPSKKSGFFTLDERLELIKKIYEKDDNISVIKGSGAAVDVALINGCSATIRGLRGLTDFDYEISLANINKQISDNEINTVCLFAEPMYQFVSSSMVKDIFNLGKDITQYVDSIILEAMQKKRIENISKFYEVTLKREDDELENAITTEKRLIKERNL